MRINITPFFKTLTSALGISLLIAQPVSAQQQQGNPVKMIEWAAHAQELDKKCDILTTQGQYAANEILALMGWMVFDNDNSEGSRSFHELKEYQRSQMITAMADKNCDQIAAMPYVKELVAMMNQRGDLALAVYGVLPETSPCLKYLEEDYIRAEGKAAYDRLSKIATNKQQFADEMAQSAAQLSDHCNSKQVTATDKHIAWNLRYWLSDLHNSGAKAYGQYNQSGQHYIRGAAKDFTGGMPFIAWKREYKGDSVIIFGLTHDHRFAIYVVKTSDMFSGSDIQLAVKRASDRKIWNLEPSTEYSATHPLYITSKEDGAEILASKDVFDSQSKPEKNHISVVLSQPDYQPDTYLAGSYLVDLKEAIAYSQAPKVSIGK